MLTLVKSHIVFFINFGIFTESSSAQYRLCSKVAPVDCSPGGSPRPHLGSGRETGPPGAVVSFFHSAARINNPTPVLGTLERWSVPVPNIYNTTFRVFFQLLFFSILEGTVQHNVATTRLAHVCFDRHGRSLERFQPQLLRRCRHCSFSDAATVFLVDSVPQPAHLWQERQGHAQSAHSGI